MYTIHKQLQYNAWANGKIVEILANADDKIFDTELKSSFPTIRKTLLHVWDAQTIWFTRMKGGETKTWPSENFKGSKAELLQNLVTSSNDIADFIAGKDNTYLESKIYYKNMKGLEFSTPVEEILFHVVNHGTFHRGQIITMLRELGYDKFPAQDLIAYLRQL
ncbi:MAG: hypothetical protein JWO06_123 [Bacteroidota bacterium]|nr:hypothetical protein [Bacteroidota bacterium]